MYACVYIACVCMCVCTFVNMKRRIGDTHGHQTFNKLPICANSLLLVFSASCYLKVALLYNGILLFFVDNNVNAFNWKPDSCPETIASRKPFG